MQRFVEIRRVGSIAVFACLLQISQTASAAETRSPGQGNPLDSLPKPQPSQPSTVRVDIQRQTADPALQRLMQTRLTPSRFQIAGVNALPFDLVAAEFSPLAKREVTIADLLRAADNVTRLYQARGYPLSFAFVPVQSFQDGVVVINVVEGYVGSIDIAGNPGRARNRLLKIAGKLRNERPLRQATLERVNATLAMQPGVHIDATVHPPANTDGAGAMTLEVRRRPVSAGIGVDSATSHLRGIVSVTENGLTPLGEQLTLSALIPGGSQHERYTGATYIQPIGARGTLFQFSFSDYRAEPEDSGLTALQFSPTYQTRTRRIAATLSHPFILDARRNLTLAGGVYTADNEARYTALAGPSVTSGSDIRALSGEFSWNTASKKNSTLFSGGVYHGIDGAGASRTNSNVDLDFTRIRATLVHTRRLPANFGVTVGVTAQYSGDILPLSEQSTYGASQFGLAYPAGEIAGDKGWAWSLELNKSLESTARYVKQIQPYLLADAAHTRGNAGDLTSRNIASVGAGIRFASAPAYTLDLSIAQPVGDIPAGASSRSPRLNLTYFYQLE